MIDQMSGHAHLAVVADASHAEYFQPRGRERAAFSQRRIERILRLRKNKAPTDPIGWIQLASYNIGYGARDTPRWFGSFDEARAAAQKTLDEALAAAQDALERRMRMGDVAGPNV